MAPTETVYLRVEPEFKERLRLRGQRSGRGLQGEVLEILRRALAEPDGRGDKAGASATVRTLGHGAEESEGTGRVEASAPVPGSASALDGWSLAKDPKPFTREQQGKGKRG